MKENQLIHSRIIITYISLLLFLSWAMQIAAISVTGDINSKETESWLIGVMCTPLLISFIFLVKYKALCNYLLWKPNRKLFVTLLPAICIPVIIAFATVAIANSMGMGKSRWFDFSSNGVMISGGPWLLGTGETNWFIFIINVLVTGIVYSMMNSLPAAMEEFAWRGLLQNILIDKLGMTKGIICLGITWSFWHLPALLNGYNHPYNPLLGSFVLQPLQEIAISFFYAWLTLKCKSFIPAALAHGAGNSLQEGVVSNIQWVIDPVFSYIIPTLVTVLIGFVTWLVMIKMKFNLSTERRN